MCLSLRSLSVNNRQDNYFLRPVIHLHNKLSAIYLYIELTVLILTIPIIDNEIQEIQIDK